MTVRQLPARPHLDQLKRQAKDLLHAARAKDPAALARFRLLPAFASLDDDAALARRGLALHDAQSVVAREHSFASWNDLRDRVEELTLELDGAVAQFVEAATGDRPDRARRILALHPTIPRTSFHAALVLGDVAAVARLLDDAPELANRRGGPRDWEPLHYVCYSALAPEHEAGIVAIAELLIARGADANLRYPWKHHDVFRPVLWAAVCVARCLPLAHALLEAGADPSDGVTLTLAASGGNVAALDLLLGHGVDVDRPWATDDSAPLYAILHWSRNDVGVRWLLAHGADPDPVFAKNGETPLHVVAASWDAALAEALVDRGAAIERARADGRTPYAVAALHGNAEVAAWLLAHGASPELSPVDRFVAECSRGDVEAAEASMRAQPELRDALAPEHYGAFYGAADRNDVRVLAVMLASGFDPNRGDESIGKTALHVAAAAGHVEAVQLLLDAGASVDVRDTEFHATPLVWAAEHARNDDEGRDFTAVARLLIAAGSPLDWEAGAEPAEQLLDLLEAWKQL